MANRFADLNPAALADAELQLARDGGACPTLQLWYAANPGDSNLQIAQHYYAECAGTPPPVSRGELSMSDVRGADEPAGAGSGTSGPFLASVRGSDGAGWPYQSDSNLLLLGQEVCSLLAEGMPAGELIGALQSAGSGATQEEVVDLVNGANSYLC